ncbi:hypothetical protein EON65_44460 [archaeon]|nr:MAG: hypothetical protein EON65_44460 [archaeon]
MNTCAVNIHIHIHLSGMRHEEDKSVSEDMLRMVVEEAQKSEGIETGEGRMIKNVLDMQDKEVEKIMTPRVDIVGVGEDMGKHVHAVWYTVYGIRYMMYVYHVADT